MGEDSNSMNEKLLSFFNVLINTVIGIFLFTICSILFIITVVEITNNSPPNDYTHVRVLEYFSKDTLNSCKVVYKDYKHNSHNIAIIKVSSVDYAKILTFFQNEDNPDNYYKGEKIYHKASINDFRYKETDKLLKKIIKKENLHIKNMEVYKNNGGKSQRRIGFIYPDIIIKEDRDIQD